MKGIVNHFTNYRFWVLVVLLFNGPVSLCQHPIEKLFSRTDYKDLQEEFKPLTWWHWINGNVTRDGIRKDLIAMKNAGLGGVQLFDTHMYTPKGPVRYGSDEWYNDVLFAIKLCDSLGMKFYMMNSPGWSGAGGPWVRVENSMKQLVFSETDLDGKHPFDHVLAQPYAKEGFYKDVAVMAVPSQNDGEEYIRKQISSVISSKFLLTLNNSFDKNLQTKVESFAGSDSAGSFIQFKFKIPLQVNMIDIEVSCPSNELNMKGRIETSLNGVDYRIQKKFDYENHFAATGNFPVSFDNDSPAIRYLRIAFEGTAARFQIKEIKLRNLYRIINWWEKTGMSHLPDEDKPEQDTGNCPMAIPPESVVDLTSLFDTASKKLKWIPPSGRWTILRFGYTTTGAMIHPAVEEGSGYEVDKLDSEAVAFQFDHAIGPMIRRAGTLVGKTFKGIVFDSWEAGYQNWTPDFRELFHDMEGFDLRKYLPVLAGRTIHSLSFSSGILRSFRNALLQGISRNYYGTMSKLAHQHGMQVFSEAEGGPMVPAFGNAFTDVPMNEFWTDGIFKRGPLIRQTVSIANILGRKIIGAEAFTSKPEYGKWQNTPCTLKKIGDLAYTMGINRFIFHTYTHQPFDIPPGFTMGRYGTLFGRLNTWWKYASEWINYLSRCQLLLQQGNIVADVCYLIPDDAGYNYRPEFILPSGYKYDILYPHDLDSLHCSNHFMEVSGGSRYRILVLDKNLALNYSELKKVSRLVENGAVLYGPIPKIFPDPIHPRKDVVKFDQLVHEMWGTPQGKSGVQNGYGEGQIYWGMPINKTLAELKLQPDLKFLDSNVADSFYYIHRRSGVADFYFISNQSVREGFATAWIRSDKKQPECWDPATGKVWDVKVFDTLNNGTSIPLRLAPEASLFLVFRRPLPNRWITSISQTKEKRSLDKIPASVILSEDNYLYPGKGKLWITWSNGQKENTAFKTSLLTKVVNTPWRVDFPDGRGAPKEIWLPKLISWTDYRDSGVRYYSGTAVYRNSLLISKKEIKNTQNCLLDLGELFDIAEVWINGKKVSVLWKRPYLTDITPFLLSGKNEIKILITNTWVNRLIGDASVSVPYKYSTNETKFTNGRILAFPDWLYDPSKKRTDKRYTFTTWNHYNANSPLLTAGLLGPVSLLFYNRIKL